jgi:hypothetical protein
VCRTASCFTLYMHWSCCSMAKFGGCGEDKTEDAHDICGVRCKKSKGRLVCIRVFLAPPEWKDPSDSDMARLRALAPHSVTPSMFHPCSWLGAPRQRRKHRLVRRHSRKSEKKSETTRTVDVQLRGLEERYRWRGSRQVQPFPTFRCFVKLPGLPASSSFSSAAPQPSSSDGQARHPTPQSSWNHNHIPTLRAAAFRSTLDLP